MKRAAGPATVSKRGRWVAAEKARLRELYGLCDETVIARRLRRPLASVRRMAQLLFSAAERSGPWTASEILALKRYLGAARPETIARILGRSVSEVQAQISALDGIRREGVWTRAEIAELKRIYGQRTDEDLVRIFGRSPEEIRRFSREYRLSKDKAFVRKLRGEGSVPMPHWRPEEVEILRDSYPRQSNLELARRLGKSVKSIASKAHRMRLEKTSERLEAMGRENVRARYLR